MSILELQSVTKIFKTGLRNTVCALDNISLSIGQGEIFGLLGPNGAGKTTLVKLILGIAFPTSGDITLFGANVRDFKVRARLGYLPENPNFPPYLSGRRAMELFGELASDDSESTGKQIDDFLGMLNMHEAASRKISTYSKGMVQRLGVAQALLNSPDIIFLDEPTDGVDPIGRRDIRSTLMRLKTAGRTVFLNSHLLSEVEMLCDRVAIIDRGQILATGALADLTAQVNRYRIECTELKAEDIADLAEFVPSLASNNEYVDVKVKSTAELNCVIDSLREKGILIKSIVPAKTSLESYFINLIEDVRGVQGEKS